VVADAHGDRARYRLLDTIRAYAAARLDAAEAGALARAHSSYFADLVCRPGSGRRLDVDDLVVRELDNIRAAVHEAVSRGDTALALTIVGRLWPHAFRRMALVESEEWARSALALPGAADHPEAVRAHVLVAVVRHLLADAVGCEHHARRAIEAERRLGVGPHPRPLLALSLGAAWQGKLDLGISAARRAAQLAARQRRVFDEAEALAYVVQWTGNAGRPPDPSLVERCLALAERSGSPVAGMIASYVTGVAWAETDPARSVAHFRDVVAVGERATYQDLLVGLARAHIVVVEHPRPACVLDGLLEALTGFRRARLPFGLRRLVRDFLPLLGELGRPDLVAVLDSAAAPLSIRPHAARRAVQDARAALGGPGFDVAGAAGRAMTDDELEAYLRMQVGEVTAPGAGPGREPTSSVGHPWAGLPGR
jgi:hypothetical protein